MEATNLVFGSGVERHDHDGTGDEHDDADGGEPDSCQEQEKETMKKNDILQKDFYLTKSLDFF